MIEEAEDWSAQQTTQSDLPLAGIPVSLKDTIVVGGFDTSVGYSCKTGKPYAEDGGLVRLLRDAGMCSILTELMRSCSLTIEFRRSSIRQDQHTNITAVL